MPPQETRSDGHRAWWRRGCAVSAAGRKLKPGDEALTDYNGRGMTRVRIVERIEGATSQSRICYRVSPPLKGGDSSSEYDADWFEPCLPDFLGAAPGGA